MAKRFTQMLGAIVFSVTTMAAQAAQAWQINPAGTGLAEASMVNMLDIKGVGFIQLFPSYTMSGAFNFIEYGAYQVLQSDQTTPFGSHDLTITYSLMGEGSFYNPLALHFNAGVANIYADANFDFSSAAAIYGTNNGTQIASFGIHDGQVASSGLVSVEAQLIAGSLLPGYIFDANGVDLAGAANVLLNLGVFNQPSTPDPLLVSEIVCGLAGYAGPGCDGSEFYNARLAYIVRDGGTATISSVSEPAMPGLMLTAFAFSLAFSRRRQIKELSSL